jgi:hypothetical protein
MPTYIQGDIFTAALDAHYDAAVAFGHLGLNEMAQAWRNAQRRVREWNDIGDPFEANANNPMEIEGNTRFWWFVPAEQNNGMSTEQLRVIFKTIFEWARKNNLTTVITNGIQDTDHGMLTNANRTSDDIRVRLISEIMTNYEREGFDVTLISLNDAYIRNFPQQHL